MGEAGGEIAIWCRETRIVLSSEEQLRQRLLEAPAEQQCGANYIENLAEPAAWAETQRSLGTLDRPIITRLLPASSTQRAHDQV